MGYLRSEEEAQMMIEEMKRKSKGKYITQGVTFNKESERQMELLKYALMYSNSFSGLGKELLAEKFESGSKAKVVTNNSPNDITLNEQQPDNVKETNESNTETVQKVDVGNFIM